MEDSFIETASDILAKLPIFSQTQQTVVRELGRFYANWKNIVGDSYYSHTRPADIKNGILIIEAEHSGWISLMQFHAGSIQKKVQAKFPELRITGVAFRLYNQLDSEIPKKKQEEPIESHSAVQEPPKELHEILDKIEDKNFKTLLEHVSISLLKSCNTGEKNDT
ncbi:MAG TPA: DUF721 domain-containing protein [Spirochaetia bacterium]|nr:DUF721 domain-containing protein [Spirochaetales bacterium]HRS64410.1 DUF721 domain-containing protein [Spirochaetia bacterium]HPD79977.1 DUF721 domain-containing protein [Spirochaetales bacterium]HQG39388.1 DUF721 domain-containing protein [Spirochaetales bacterium]HQK34305.1 DUF721 domain-containing protein [Spirochaetales bacterium]